MVSITYLLFLSLLSHSILLSKCDEDDDLLKGINVYRTALNLTTLNVTKGAECVADEIADVYKNQTCTNTTSPNATTLSNFPGYLNLLTKCGLNTTGHNTTNTTGNGQILPACVPNQQPNLVSEFTSKYATYLNSTQFCAIGVGSEDDWIVVLLTNMTEGGASNGASGLTAIGPVMFSLICFFILV